MGWFWKKKQSVSGPTKDQILNVFWRWWCKFTQPESAVNKDQIHGKLKESSSFYLISIWISD